MANAQARAPRMRDPTTEDLYEAYRYKHVPRSGLPLPKKAPKREARQYPFHKTRDGTGSVLGDLLKRGIYQLQDLIGDCRRDILHQLPANDKNKTLLKNLSVKHNVLRERLGKKIDEMERDTGIVYTAPVYFKDFPALED